MKRLVSWLTLLLVVLSGCGAASRPTAGPKTATSSPEFILGRENDLWRFAPATTQWTRLTQAAPAAAATQPALSPDGTQIAHLYRPALPTPSLEQPFVVPINAIHLMPVDGGAGKALYTPTEGYDSVDQPAWSPDGATIYATYRTLRFTPEGIFTRSGDDIVAITGADGSLRNLITQATFPAPAPNGTALAFVRTPTDAPPAIGGL